VYRKARIKEAERNTSLSSLVREFLVSLGNQPALVAALSYILFPADLSKQILMHRAFVHAANTSVLLGTLLYQRDTPASKFASYVLASLSLIIWEGSFFGFIAAPFLISNGRAPFFQRLWKHLATNFEGREFYFFLTRTVNSFGKQNQWTFLERS